jgi:hypothetical protein
MRRGILLQYAGTGSGWGTSSVVYGPETPITTQIAYARSTIANVVSSGTGSSVKIELWTENFPVKRWTGRPGRPSVSPPPSGSGGPYSVEVRLEGNLDE